MQVHVLGVALPHTLLGPAAGKCGELCLNRSASTYGTRELSAPSSPQCALSAAQCGASANEQGCDPRYESLYLPRAALPFVIIRLALFLSILPPLSHPISPSPIIIHPAISITASSSLNPF